MIRNIFTYLMKCPLARGDLSAKIYFYNLIYVFHCVVFYIRRFVFDTTSCSVKVFSNYMNMVSVFFAIFCTTL